METKEKTEMMTFRNFAIVFFLIASYCAQLCQCQESPDFLLAALADNKALELEYEELYDTTDDKAGLESVRILHKQLDDDNDGAIEPSETCDFIRGDLHKDKDQEQLRQRQFHRKDAEITVKELWNTWWKGEVHNWTVDQTIHWLVHNVELPQYEPDFRRHAVDGTKLPQVAVVGSPYLAKVIGIPNSIHRSKISLKAMDVVLFGPPKELPGSVWKDAILTSLLIVALSGLFMAYRQNRHSQAHLRKMASDMEGLSKAEEELQDLQEKLQQRDSKLQSLQQINQQQQQQQQNSDDHSDVMEVSRLKEQVESLRNELHRAEIELEDRCWMAPPMLQQWLQLTFEMETLVYNSKKAAAEDQFKRARELCEKLKRKRSSLVGAFVSAHGCSVDEVDKSILDAKVALLEVTQDLAERTHRWRQIEALCGCPIVTNPGLGKLKNQVRYSSGGRLISPPSLAQMGSADLTPTDELSSNEQDDHLLETPHFVSRGATVGAPPSVTSSVASVGTGSILPSKSNLQTLLETNESRSSSVAESIKDLELMHTSHANLIALTHLQRNSSSSSFATSIGSHGSSGGLAPHGKIGPGGRKMVKSFSHGAGSSMAATVAAMSGKAAVNGKVERARKHFHPNSSSSNMSFSMSDSHLQSKIASENEEAVKIGDVTQNNHSSKSIRTNGDSIVMDGGGSDCHKSPADGDATDSHKQAHQQLNNSCTENHGSDAVDTEDSAGSTASDGENMLDKSLGTKKSQKLKKFFNFSRKKERVV